jgi:hypothetical protein
MITFLCSFNRTVYSLLRRKHLVLPWMRSGKGCGFIEVIRSGLWRTRRSWAGRERFCRQRESHVRANSGLGRDRREMNLGWIIGNSVPCGQWQAFALLDRWPWWLCGVYPGFGGRLDIFTSYCTDSWSQNSHNETHGLFFSFLQTLICSWDYNLVTSPPFPSMNQARILGWGRCWCPSMPANLGLLWTHSRSQNEFHICSFVIKSYANLVLVPFSLKLFL